MKEKSVVGSGLDRMNGGVMNVEDDLPSGEHLELDLEDVEIIEDLGIIGHFTDKYIAINTAVEFGPYMFRLKVVDDEEESISMGRQNSVSCVVYLDPMLAKDLRNKLSRAIERYESIHGRIGRQRGGDRRAARVMAAPVPAPSPEPV